MTHPTLQFRLAGSDRFALVDDGPEHVVLRVDADLAPRAALRAEIDAIRARADAALKKANLLEAALEQYGVDLTH